MTEPLLLAKNNEQELYLLPKMANHHGLITGAVITLQTVPAQPDGRSFAIIGSAGNCC